MWATQPSSIGDAPRGAIGRVLIVDDHPKLRSMLSTAVEAAGFQAAQVASLAEAQDWLRRCWPDAVVLDLQRAETQGLHAVRCIRACPALDGVSLVFLAGDLGGGLRWRALQAGADRVMQKPLSLIELQDCVSRLVRKGRPRPRSGAAWATDSSRFAPPTAATRQPAAAATSLA